MTSKPFVLLIVLTGFALGYSAGSRAGDALRGTSGGGRIPPGSAVALGALVGDESRAASPDEQADPIDLAWRDRGWDHAWDHPSGMGRSCDEACGGPALAGPVFAGPAGHGPAQTLR